MTPAPPARFQIAYGSRSTARVGRWALVAALAIPAAIALFALPHGPVAFEIDGYGLRVTGDPDGRFVRLEDLKEKEARPLDLNAEPSFALDRRADRIGLPGYRSGWFDTKGAGKALVFVADWSHAVVIPTRRGYSLILGPDDPKAFLDSLKVPPARAAEYHLATDDPNLAGIPPGLPTLWAILFGVPLLVAIPLAALGVGTRRVVFEVGPDALRIRGALFGRRVPLATLRLDEARVVDLADGPDRLALSRTMGVGLPGYLSGWFRARGHEGKFLVFLTERTRVVRIPTTEGYTLLLSPAAPGSFLKALRVPVASGA